MSTTTGDEEPFEVQGRLHGRDVLITTGSVLAAQQVTQHLRGKGAVEVSWQLRDDLPQPRPMLLLTRAEGAVHGTELVPGKPAADHPEALCGMELDWAADPGPVVVSELDSGSRCPDCLARFAEVMRQLTTSAIDEPAVVHHPAGRYLRAAPASNMAATSGFVLSGVSDE